MIRKAWLFDLFILSILTVLLLSQSGETQLTEASQMNQEGFTFLYGGDPTAAVVTWRKAEELYEAENNQEGMIGSQLNQSLAEQALGLYPRACQTVVQALMLPDNVCEEDIGGEEISASLSKLDLTEVNRLGVRLLGENLRALGSLAEAEAALIFLEKQPSQDLIEQDRVILALGNVHHLLFKESIQVYKRIGFKNIHHSDEIVDRVNRQVEQASTLYMTATSSASPEIATKAQLNVIDLMVNVSRSLSSFNLNLDPDLFLSLKSNAQSAYVSLTKAGFESLPAIDSLYGRLNLASNLMAILQSAQLGNDFGSTLDFSRIENLISGASVLAKQLDHKRALSFAAGIEAELDEQRSAPISEIEAKYTQAFSLAQSIQAFDISYTWAYKLAQLNESRGRDQQAVAYYESSLVALGQVREDLIAVNSELRFNFSEKVEPVYKDYLKFLVSKRSPDFKQAIQVHQSFHLAQLENFLRCGRLLSSAPKEEATVSVHVINLDDFIEVIVERGNSVRGYHVPSKEVLHAAQNLSLNLQSPSFLEVPESEFLPYAQVLYDSLIRPAVASGSISATEPLRFVLDAPFQSLPMGILHDGEQYLAASHSLSRSLQLKRSGSSLDLDGALFAGLSEQALISDELFNPEDFLPLPETKFEAESLKNYIQPTILLNNNFTVAKLGSEMSAKNYEIVHISTHGQFSSIPQQTFLVAWDELINVPQMAQLFQDSGSIDLLVLSACQTAAGDERSVLGLAGLAIQSGAQRAVASLWLVDSAGSSVLMDRFYKGLGQGLSKSESLHQAQLTLMKSTNFSHPFYWAPFLLVEG